MVLTYSCWTPIWQRSSILAALYVSDTLEHPWGEYYSNQYNYLSWDELIIHMSYFGYPSDESDPRIFNMTVLSFSILFWSDINVVILPPLTAFSVQDTSSGCTQPLSLRHALRRHMPCLYHDRCHIWLQPQHNQYDKDNSKIGDREWRMWGCSDS